MRIFVADEHPLRLFADTCRHARQIPPCAGFHDIAYGREKEGAVSARKWLPFYASSKAPASRGQLTNRAATISDGGAAFHVFGCPLNGGRQVSS